MLVVDTCVIIDIADADPTYGTLSAQCLEAHLNQGLTISPISYVELAPVFDNSTRLLDEFLDGVGIEKNEQFSIADRYVAFNAWARHIIAKRTKVTHKRPVADALIGALAIRLDGIITRNGNDFRSFYPKLLVIDPSH
ncbi:MAG: PIN domain-containing protein [Deltaproteobacteria bacterium]|nr:PIN domain-containing protein [Deltaproteobacteria bacterium]